MMTYRRICAAAISIAIILSGAVFPGGAILCREGNGDVNLEPFHAPHASSCAPGNCDSDETGDSSVMHRHERCTDSEASVFPPPAKKAENRPGPKLAPVAANESAEPAFVLDRTVRICSAAPPPPRSGRSTILRI